jgi:hypothetical protein
MIENQFARIALTLGPLVDLLSPLPPRNLSRPRGSPAHLRSQRAALRAIAGPSPSATLMDQHFGFRTSFGLCSFDLRPSPSAWHQARLTVTSFEIQRISNFFKGFQTYSNQKNDLRYCSARRPRLRVKGASRPVCSLPRYAPQPAFGTAALGRARIPM